MGKVYIDTVKYLVYATIEIDGIVEKPDVVGAVFGQTEGLLGDELDLRELQKGGRIGRIEVDLQIRGGKTVGKITLPSSLDMVETSILAAALETVDRVGPCEARIKVDKMEDTRNVKRKQVVERAKTLLQTLLIHEIPESKEISELVRQEVKIAEIQEYGPERLPCGPMIDDNDALVVVEGRADVLNLLRNDVKNAIAIGGANVPQAIIKLSREKEITVFLDGDRGGGIILKELMQAADIDYVARAPPGKEVEELTRKELIKCLRNRIPVEQESEKEKRNQQYNNYQSMHNQPFRKKFMRREERREERRYEETIPYVEQPSAPSQSQVQVEGIEQIAGIQHESPNAQTQNPQAPPAQTNLTVPAPSAIHAQPSAPQPAKGSEAEKGIDRDALFKSLEKLENTLRARIYGDNLELKAEIPVRDLIKALTEFQSVKAVVFDGIVTQRLVDLASERNIGVLVGVKRGNLFKKPENVSVLTKE